MPDNQGLTAGARNAPAFHPGDVAQLGERGVRNAEVGSSILLVSILQHLCETRLLEFAVVMEMRITENREAILEIGARHGARNIRVFGSAVRGELQGSSDIDFLVDLEPGRDLLDLGAFLMDLEELLGCRVETVTEPALHERIRGKVLQEAVPL